MSSAFRLRFLVEPQEVPLSGRSLPQHCWQESVFSILGFQRTPQGLWLSYAAEAAAVPYVPVPGLQAAQVLVAASALEAAAAIWRAGGGLPGAVLEFLEGQPAVAQRLLQEVAFAQASAAYQTANRPAIKRWEKFLSHPLKFPRQAPHGLGQGWPGGKPLKTTVVTYEEGVSEGWGLGGYEEYHPACWHLGYPQAGALPPSPRFIAHLDHSGTNPVTFPFTLFQVTEVLQGHRLQTPGEGEPGLGLTEPLFQQLTAGLTSGQAYPLPSAPSYPLLQGVAPQAPAVPLQGLQGFAPLPPAARERSAFYLKQFASTYAMSYCYRGTSWPAYARQRLLAGVPATQGSETWGPPRAGHVEVTTSPPPATTRVPCSDLVAAYHTWRRSQGLEGEVMEFLEEAPHLALLLVEALVDAAVAEAQAKQDPQGLELLKAWKRYQQDPLKRFKDCPLEVGRTYRGMKQLQEVHVGPCRDLAALSFLGCHQGPRAQGATSPLFTLACSLGRGVEETVDFTLAQLVAVMQGQALAPRGLPEPPASATEAAFRHLRNSCTWA